MVTDEDRLLDAIRDEPDEDLPRLIYADWLDDHRQPERAELIRVQCVLAGERPTTKARGREKALLAAHEGEWMGALALLPGLSFQRGMAAVEWKSPKQFVEGAEFLTAAGDPAWVVERRLKLDRFTVDEPGLEALVRDPHFALLTHLELEGREKLTAASARVIAESPLSAHLRGLALENAELGPAGAKALANSPHLRRLRHLSLSGARLEPKGLTALMSSKHLEGLTQLILNYTAPDEEAMRALAAAPGPARLANLNLGSNKIGDARLRRLLGAPWVGRLADLRLPGNVIRDGGAEAIAGCAALSGLRRLNLNVNSLTDRGALALIESPHLASLEELDIGFNRITEPVLKQLRKRFRPRRR
jgi:uncharacterized protein (TIGR02996 family)